MSNLQALRWTQNGVKRILKLLPNGRIGILSDEMLHDIKQQSDEWLNKWFSMSPQEKRGLQAKEERKDITTSQLIQWETVINGKNGAIPITVCKPTQDKVRPCVIYIHGGGWCTGSAAHEQNACRYLAEQADALTINVEYRLAPENQWPKGFDDCWDAVCYAYNNAEALSIDRDRIVVSGDSAGGNLAALCSHRDRNENTGMIKGQVLYYAAVAVGSAYEIEGYEGDLDDYVYDDSQKELIEPRIKLMLSSREGGKPVDGYLPDGINCKTPAVSPLWDINFSNLPQTLLITAQYDGLTQQNRLYANKLASAGVDVTLMNYCGVAHGFIGRLGHYPQTDDSLREFAAFVRDL